MRSDTGMAHPHVDSDWNNMIMYYLYSSCQILSTSRSQPRCDYHFFNVNVILNQHIECVGIYLPLILHLKCLNSDCNILWQQMSYRI